MRSLIIALIMTSALLAGCTAGNGGDVTAIETDDDYFEVKGQSATRNGETTAEVGEEFEFTNDGERDHTVTVHRPPAAADVFLVDDVLQPGDSTTFTFDEPGTYHVYCRFHGDFTSGMRLTVAVE